MKKIEYSPDYRDKIRLMKQDLDTRFSKEIRMQVFRKINAGIQSIRQNEAIGAPVCDLLGINTDYRMLFISRNYVFYRITEEAIRIVNIYNEREDFMWDLFGIRTIPPETEEYWNE